jgi:hypothetical protein
MFKQILWMVIYFFHRKVLGAEKTNMKNSQLNKNLIAVYIHDTQYVGFL